MYNGKQVIDIHGHHSTPPHFRAYAYNLIALRTVSGRGLEIPDDVLESALTRHIEVMDERNVDVQFISPRPVAMMHWEQPHLVEHWTQTTNDTIAQTIRLHPDRFRGIAQLPQVGIEFSGDSSGCVPELERAVTELGFVGAMLNPDPAGDRQTPGMNDEYWFPLYEAAEALESPLVVHASITRDPRVTIIPHNYQYNFLTEQTLATQLLENSTVFEDFPRLRVVVCHCGGAPSRFVPRAQPSGLQGGGQVGIGHRAAPAHAAIPEWNDNLFFDTCSYDQDYLETAIKQRGVNQMMFGTEAPGSGTAVLNPDTGKPADDMVPVVDRIGFLTQDDKDKIFRRNALRVFPLFKD